MADTPQSSSAEFTLEIPACGPIKQNGDKGRIIINFGAGSSYGPVILNEEECQCDCPDKLKYPPRIYDLKKRCPDEADQQELFAWDCETNYEAEDEKDALSHDAKMAAFKNGVATKSRAYYPAKPPWVSDCKKCKCKLFIQFIIQGNAEEMSESGQELYSYDIKQKGQSRDVIKEFNVASNGRGKKEFGKTEFKADVDENGKAENEIRIEVSFAKNHTGTGQADITIEVWEITPEESYILETKTGPGSYNFSCKL